MKKRPAIIIGGGPAGSATALYLLQSGVQPLIIERESFPRFHIGESLSGECGAGLRTLDLEPEIRRQKHEQIIRGRSQRPRAGERRQVPVRDHRQLGVVTYSHAGSLIR